MKKRQYTYLVSCAVITIFSFSTAAVLNVGYYTKADLLGPLSKFPEVFVPLAVVIALTMAYVIREGPNEDRTIGQRLILLSPVVLLILYLLFLPDAIESFVITNHSDVPYHLERASYVVATGRSNPNIDWYFDWQPGVFYAAAAFMMITRIEPHLIAKWFPLFFVIFADIPALVFLGKTFFKDRRDLIMFVFLALVVTWVPARYHFSAQVYALPLFSILVGLLTRRSLDAARLVVFILISGAIILLHQGVALFALTMMVSMLLFERLGRLFFVRVRVSGGTSRVAVLFSVMWLGYLGWVTTHALGDFITITQDVFIRILGEPFTLIVGRAVARPDPTYQLLINAKLLFTAFLYFAGSGILGYLWIRKRASRSGAILATILGVSAVIFAVGFPLGGAGFVERAVLMTAPLLAIGLTLLMSRIARMNSSLPIAILLISLTITGSTFFNSNRNFESRLLSEGAADQFLVSATQFLLPSYGVPRWLNDASVGIIPKGIFVLFPSYLIESSYYIPIDVLSNATATINQEPNTQRVYSNGVSTVYLVR